MQSDKNQRLKIILAFAAVYIIWGTTYLTIRIAVVTIPPFFLAGMRFIAAGVLMVLFLRARGAERPQRNHWRGAIIVGALLVAGGSGLVHWSEQTIPSSIAALVIATVPLWIFLFDWLVFKGGRPGKKAIAGLLSGEASRLDLAAISPLAWLSFFYMVFFGSIITFTAYIWLLQNVEASKVSSYSYVNPVIAVFLGWLILSEPITPTTIVAVVIIIFAVILITTRQPVPTTSENESYAGDKATADIS